MWKVESIRFPFVNNGNIPLTGVENIQVIRKDHCVIPGMNGLGPPLPPLTTDPVDVPNKTLSEVGELDVLNI